MGCGAVERIVLGPHGGGAPCSGSPTRRRESCTRLCAGSADTRPPAGGIAGELAPRVGQGDAKAEQGDPPIFCALVRLCSRTMYASRACIVARCCR